MSGPAVAIAMMIAAAPPTASGTRTVAGQRVETNPNWGRTYSTAARYGAAYGRGPVPSPAARPKTPDLRYRGMTNKFTVNMFNGVISAPTRDLWLSAPTPVR